MKVRQQRFQFRCRDEDPFTDVWVLAGDGYSLKQLIGDDRENRVVQVATDPAWAELETILASLGIDPRSTAGAAKFLKAYPATVDGFTEAHRRFDHRPSCERGAARISWWGPVDPPEFRDADVPLVTHVAWSRRPTNERQQIVAALVGGERQAM